MLKVLSKIFLSVLLFLNLSLKAQNSLTISPTRYQQWVQVGSSCYGCSSFYLMVVNETTPRTDGLYYYNVYLWSNSFYNNGYVSSTYIKTIKIYSKDISGTETFLLKLDYALIPPKSDYFDGVYHLAYLYSYSARETIKITWFDKTIW